MKTSYEYDQDPRYGWVLIEMGDRRSGDVLVTDRNGLTHGFTYQDGKMTPTCICHAWNEGECACTNLEHDYWNAPG